jgi:hypothetical protein
MKKVFALVYVAVALVIGLSMLCSRANAVPVTLDEQTVKLLRGANNNHWFITNPLVSTLLGGVLATAAGLVGAYWAHKLQVGHDQSNEARFAENVLRAIRYELEGLAELYDNNIGGLLKKHPEGQVFETKFYLSEKWFAVFDANAAHFGKIDGDLARRIIIVYGVLKVVIELYRINNEGLAALSDALIQSQSGGMSASQRLITIRSYMIVHAARIKETDKLLKTKFDDLISALDQRGIT